MQVMLLAAYLVVEWPLSCFGEPITNARLLVQGESRVHLPLLLISSYAAPNLFPSHSTSPK